ncbi:hypothetical protein DMUE_2196 [Dictyocoela muelleri]|nr:hypothetical protein DMUE_2196 [Dictyocoela muelleri]
MITLKKINFTTININSKKTNRSEYARTYLDIGEDKIKIFIDESSCNFYLRRTFSRSQWRSTVSVVVPSNRGLNASLISAISNENPLFGKIYTVSINFERFINFMEELLNICFGYYDLENCVFIMDNAKIHHSNISRGF